LGSGDASEAEDMILADGLERTEAP